MPAWSRLATAVAVIVAAAAAGSAEAQCRRVGPIESVRLDPAAMQDLAGIGVTRAVVFEALADVSQPETGGCWAGAAGNFDGQIVSAGVLQWNYGQGTLQPLMARFRAAFASRPAFEAELARLMPQHGKTVFSEGCLGPQITADCRDALLALQTPDHKLQPSLKQELDALFESDQMIQLQVDRFVALVGSVRDDLKRLFPNRAPSIRAIKWAIDTKVQQGAFPSDQDVAGVRARWVRMGEAERRNALLALVMWYEGLCRSADQGGTRLDCEWNAARWRERINRNRVSDEHADLLHLTFLRSRTAQGMSGHWQALTFQRRARIALGVGSVGGHRIGE